MNKLNQQNKKELDLLIEEANQHVFNGHFHWMGAEQNDYIVWKTRAKALLGIALPSDSPDWIRIKEHQKPGCVDLDFQDYAGMLLGVSKYNSEHQQ